MNFDSQPLNTQTVMSLLGDHQTPWWRAIACTLPYKQIGIADEVYMTRYVLNQQPGLSVYLHEFHREDWARETHDHPWPFWHQILEGGYVEEVVPWQAIDMVNSKEGEDGKWYIKRRPGYQAMRDATYKHRVARLLARPCWSLVIVGERVRDWGFDCPDGWVAFKEHMARGGVCAEGGAV